MASTTPDGIYSPDLTGEFNYVGDLGMLASSVQTALVKRSWYYVGSDAQRLALQAPELRDGITWEDPSTGRMWTRRAGAWVEKDLVRSLGRITPVTTGTQTGITSTPTKVTGTDLNITLSAPTMLRFYANVVTYSTNVADVLLFSVKDGESTVYDMTTQANSSATIAATSRSQLLITERVIPAGAHAFSLFATRAAGPGQITVSPAASAPTTFSVDRIG